MKKLIVLLLAAVLVLGTVTAYANPSVGTLKEEAVASEDTSIDTEGLTPDEAAQVAEVLAELADPNSGTSFEIKNPDVADRYEDQYTLENGETLTKEDIAKVVDTVNDPDAAPMTVADAVKGLKAGNTDALAAYTVYDDGVAAQKPLNLNDYSFMTGFSDLVLDQNGEESYDVAGQEVSTTVTLKLDVLQGETDAQKLAEDLMVLLINPLTGETVFITLDAEDIDLSKNPPEVKIEFPFLGTFALITK